jgi:hypothetical protein
MSTEHKLKREGWKVASITSGDHLRRMLGMYEELGIETRIEEIGPDECAGCRECYRTGNETQYRVYIKRDRYTDPGNRKT